MGEVLIRMSDIFKLLVRRTSDSENLILPLQESK